MNENLALAIGWDAAAHGGDQADHPFPAGHRGTPLGANHQLAEEEDEHREHQDRRQDESPGQLQRGRGQGLLLEEEEKTNHQCNRSREPHYPERRRQRLGGQEPDPGEQQQHSEQADRQEVEAEGGQQERDAPENARDEQSGVRELEIEPEQPDHPQQHRQIRVGDHREGPIPEAHLGLDDDGVGGIEGDLGSVNPGHGPAVDRREKLLGVVGHKINQAGFERLRGRPAPRLRHPLLGEGHIAAAALGDGPEVGGGVGLDLPAQGLRHFAAGPGDGSGRAHVGARRHPRDVGRQGDQVAGGGGAGAGRPHEDGDGHRAVQDRLDDLAHRGVEAARGVEADQDESGARLLRRGDRRQHPAGRYRVDDVHHVHLMHVRSGGGDGRRDRGRDGHREADSGGEGEMAPGEHLRRNRVREWCGVP